MCRWDRQSTFACPHLVQSTQRCTCGTLPIQRAAVTCRVRISCTLSCPLRSHTHQVYIPGTQKSPHQTQKDPCDNACTHARTVAPLQAGTCLFCKHGMCVSPVTHQRPPHAQNTAPCHTQDTLHDLSRHACCCQRRTCRTAAHLQPRTCHCRIVCNVRCPRLGCTGRHDTEYTHWLRSVG